MIQKTYKLNAEEDTDREEFSNQTNSSNSTELELFIRANGSITNLMDLEETSILPEDYTKDHSQLACPMAMEDSSTQTVTTIKVRSSSEEEMDKECM